MQAVASVQRAQDRVAAAESDLRVAQAVLRDATLAKEAEAIEISEAAVAEARLGVADAQRLLQRARALMLARDKTVQEMKFWTTSKQPVGALIVPIEGAVHVYGKDGSGRSAALGAARAGERIETGLGGKARLFVAGGSGQVDLRDDTAFTIVEDDVVSGFLGELEYGFGRFLKAQQVKFGKKFEVRTPSAVLAVRGTRFEIEASETETLIKVTQGMVAVTPRSGGEAVEVAAGWQRRYVQGQGFLEPEALPVTDSGGAK